MSEEQGLFHKIRRSLEGRNENALEVTDRLISVLEDGEEQGILDKNETLMIQNIFEFGETDAGDIMTHRKNIVALDGDDSLADTMNFVLEQINSRFPIYDETIDSIIGSIHLRDIMKSYMQPELRTKKIRELSDFIRPVSFIPETKGIDTLFKQMKKDQNHLAIVLDEYGQTMGLVTMEDIIEEIMGNILDEYDRNEAWFVPNADGSFIVNGTSRLEDLEDLLPLEFSDEEYETLNGFLIAYFEHIPGNDETCIAEYDGFRFTVLHVENNVIQRVKIEPMNTMDENRDRELD